MSPQRAFHQCAEPGCGELVRDVARCPTHARAPWAGRPSGAARGYSDPEYRRAAAQVRREESRCWRCGAILAAGEGEVDHVVPLARGGSHARSNLRLACRRCNQSRGAIEGNVSPRRGPRP